MVFTSPTKVRDWTRESESPGVVRWGDWASRVANALASGDESEKAQAWAGLKALATYMDDEYDAGYDGIALEPLESMGFDMNW